MPNKPDLKGKEIVDPQMASFMQLDSIRNALRKQNEMNVQVLNTMLVMQEHLKAIRQAQQVVEIPLIDKMEEVRQLLVSWTDIGESRTYMDTATTTVTIYDLIKDYGFPVKGYMLANDGANTIEICHTNIKGYNSGAEDDVAPERFFPIYSGDPPYKDIYKTATVQRIDIKTMAGASNYRLWVYW